MNFGLSESVSNTYHALFMFSFDVWKDLDLDIPFIWDRIDNPQPREDGSVPEPDDLRMNGGVGWEY